MEPVAFGIKATAEGIGVSERTVIRMIHDGRIRAVRLGRRVLVPRSEIERVTAIPEAPVATVECAR